MITLQNKKETIYLLFWTDVTNYLNSLKMKLVKAGEITTLTMEAIARTMEADAAVEEVVMMAIEVVEEVA